MQTAPVLRHNQLTGLYECVESAYNGPIARKVWITVNMQFLRLNAANYFFPYTPEDAYNAAILEMERVAERFSNAEVKTETASIETYLVSVAFKAFHHFHCRVVAPMRKEYRQTELLLANQEESDEETQPMTAQQLAEELPGEPDATTRRNAARALLNEICDSLLNSTPPRMDIVEAFAAYIATNGNLRQAAALCRVPERTFYSRWPKYLATAKGAL